MPFAKPEQKVCAHVIVSEVTAGAFLNKALHACIKIPGEFLHDINTSTCTCTAQIVA